MVVIVGSEPLMRGKVTQSLEFKGESINCGHEFDTRVTNGKHIPKWLSRVLLSS